MRHWLVTTFVLLLFLSGCGESRRDSGPPSGLTAYGRTIWNIDALLHDTFGKRQFWADYGASQPDFSTKFLGLASSVPWPFTFATARHSGFTAVRPKHPPRIATFVTGSDVPVKIEGAYISCGNGTWLYSRNGQAYPDGDLWCSKPEHTP